MDNPADVHNNEGLQSDVFAPETPVESAEPTTAQADEELPEQEELKAPELRENKVIYTLVIILAVLAIVCLFVVLFFISKQGAAATASDASHTASSTSQGTQSKSGSTSSNTGSNAIKVVKVTSTVYENGALEGDAATAVSDTKSAAQKAAEYQNKVAAELGDTSSQPAVTKTTTTKTQSSAQPAAYTEQTKATSSDVIDGVDEDVAKANLRAQGYKAYSVYVCDANTINGSASRPKAGVVLSHSAYTGRTVGEKLAFVNTATTASYANARKVPDLKGKAWKTARATLAKRGLRIRFEYEDKSPSKYGTVVFQAPAAGTYMPSGCSVIVVLAD